MPWINWIPENEAGGRLAEIYTSLAGPEGLDHILKIHSLNPESLVHHYQMYAHLMRSKSDLSRGEREMIAVAVSRSNDCFY